MSLHNIFAKYLVKIFKSECKREAKKKRKIKQQKKKEKERYRIKQRTLESNSSIRHFLHLVFHILSTCLHISAHYL